MTEDLDKQKRSLELGWQYEYNQHGKYTLNMVEIDEKIRSIITQIKAEEFKVADRENKISDSAAQVSCGNLDKRHIAENVLLCRDLLHSI